MKKTTGLKIFIRNLLIGTCLFVLLAGIVSRFLHTILSSSHYTNMNNTYSKVKEEFKLDPVSSSAYQRQIDDSELLNELTYAICLMATSDSSTGTYNYGCIVDSNTGEVLRDTTRSTFVFGNAYNPNPQVQLEDDTQLYVIDTQGSTVDISDPEYQAVSTHLHGSDSRLNAKDLPSFKNAFEDLKKELEEKTKKTDDYTYATNIVSDYKVTSDYLSTINHPCVEFRLADRIQSPSSVKTYDIYYYAVNKNWVTHGIVPDEEYEGNLNLSDFIYKDVTTIDSLVDEDQLYGIDGTGAYYITVEDGVLKTEQKIADIANANKILVDRILQIMMITILIIVFLSTFVEYFRKKEMYNRDQYRKVLMDSMAHDLKSPLMSMSGYAENLKENVHTEKKDYYADSILQNIQYMNKIINDDLEISRLDNMNKKLEKEDTNLISLLEEKLNHYQDKISTKKLTVEVTGTFSIQADKRLMNIVAENLITNCLCYCNENGTIEIVGKDKSLTIRNTTDMKYKGSMKDLWEPFVKGDSSRSGRNGTGLGLAIVAKILDRHKMKYKLSYNKSEKKFSCTIKK